MCMPPNGNSSLQCIGKARGVNAAQWAVDQRPFVWVAETATKRTEKPPSRLLWTAWTDTFYPGAALPFAGIQTKAGGSEEPFEADSSLSLGSRLRASETTPDSKEIEILQTKVWELQKNGQEAAAAPTTPSFFSSPLRAANGGDTNRPSVSKNGSVVSSTSSPTMSMPVDSDSTQAPHPIDPWESSRSEVERSRNSSCVKELNEDGRMNNPGGLKRKLSSCSASTGKTSTITHHKERHYSNRPAASKKEIFASNKDVDMSLTVADIEDPSYDEEEGGPGVSEKRRKRMLSNRASAQRSRQRRQDRLDTLEVLVAELRVENAALTRKANNAASSAKKLEEENKTLRDRVTKQEQVPLSDSNASNESDKTTENSDVQVSNKTGSWRTDIGGRFRNDSSNDIEETRRDNSLSRANSGASKKERGDELVERSKRWGENITSSSFDFDFNSDVMQSATVRETFSRTALPDTAVGVNMKDLYQSANMSLTQNPSFNNDLEQCYLEMDKTDLDTRSVEDIWLESLANCLK